MTMTNSCSEAGCQTKSTVIYAVSEEPKGFCWKHWLEFCTEDEPWRKCQGCEPPGSFAPSHNGSRMCESGSIASGGDREHCTCDRCF